MLENELSINFFGKGGGRVKQYGGGGGDVEQRSNKEGGKGMEG